MLIEERTLDLNKQNNRSAQIKPIILRRGENNQTQLKFTINANDSTYSLADMTPQFCAFTSTDNWVKDPDNTQVSGNTVTYTVQSNLTSSPGEVKVAYIEFRKGSQILTSDGIPILVLPDVDMTEEEAAEYQSTIDRMLDTLDEALKETRSATTNANNAATKATEAADKANKAINKVVSSKYEYQLSDSSSTPPTGTWSTSSKTEQGKYLWTRTTTTYESGASVTYSVAYEGKDGEVLGDERLTAVEQKVDSINDYTTGVNLLRGTRDFKAGTKHLPSDFSQLFFTDGFYLQGNPPITYEDGYAVIFSDSSSKGAFSSPITGLKKGDTLTVSFEYRFDTINQGFAGQVVTMGAFNVRDKRWSSALQDSIEFRIQSSEYKQKETGKWYQFVTTVYIAADIDAESLVIIGLYSANNIPLYIRKPDVVINAINHPIWSPSPFDVDYINDFTTGINLLRGTRDFVVGTTRTPENQYVMLDGFRLGSTSLINFTKDSDGFTVANFTGSTTLYSHAVYNADKTDYTVFAMYMFDSDDTNDNVKFGITSIGNGIVNVGTTTINNTGDRKWHLVVVHAKLNRKTESNEYIYVTMSGVAGFSIKMIGLYEDHINHPIYSQSPQDTINAVNGVVPTDKGGTGNNYGASPMNSLANGEDLFKLYEKAPIGTSFYYAYSSSTVTSILNKPISSNSPIAVICNVYDNHQQAQLLCQVFTANGTTRVFNTSIGATSGANQWVELAHISDLTAANLSGVVPIEKGGHGGKNASEARTNLSVPYQFKFAISSSTSETYCVFAALGNAGVAQSQVSFMACGFNDSGYPSENSLYTICVRHRNGNPNVTVVDLTKQAKTRKPEFFWYQDSSGIAYFGFKAPAYSVGATFTVVEKAHNASSYSAVGIITNTSPTAPSANLTYVDIL